MGFSIVKDILSKIVVMIKLAFLKMMKNEEWKVNEIISNNTSTKIMIEKKSS
jgi:hypothetical protein